MKLNETKSDSTDELLKSVKKNGTIEKKQNKKKKNNFEVRVPRIIVRNLNFKVNETQLKKAFEKCSTSISNVSIVARDGVSKGFGFVTFDKLEDAQKAVQEMNGQKVLGRPMAVDWSLPKNVYQKMQTKASSAPVRNNSYGIQSEPNPPEIEEEPEDEHQDDDDEEDDDDDDEEDLNDDEEEEEEEPKIRTDESSRDVREHRTLFVRNIPYDTTEDELSKILSSNGQYRIQSCRLVIDRISRHPRGSAFVQFASSEDAEKCVNLPFTIQGQQLQLDMALGRGELVKAKELRDKKNENNKKNDQRNLSLANYGVILNLDELDGNENDLRKRQNLEDVKKQKLKDPLFFISPTRLTIHNLPPNIDDEQLRKLIVETLKKDKIPMKDIILNECRVMKKNKDSKKALGFGFINLSRHEIALRLIELLNNNKYVFGSNRRPIVQFSIENRRALQLQEQRRERIHAKQELIKNPANRTLSFESNTKKKQNRTNVLEQTNNKVRLSEVIKQQIKQEAEENEANNLQDDNEQFMDVDNKKTSNNNKNNEKTKKKRLKTKSKGEIRDKVDRMIANSRNKPQLPKKTKKKWFE
ncbi:unnamed protein product [Adineta steineri]|uniref:RRM domain-containing protein n=1 Tax=Adineta steineri TaxID=433720 RepID=A0A814ITS3_9BILA|nr:unnamed protein product [Adineta steineri]CAF1400892.1 unnamed protein product [Adineta steineri]